MIDETLRIITIAFSAFREAKRDVNLGGKFVIITILSIIILSF